MKHLRISHYKLWDPLKQTTGLNMYNHSTQYTNNSVFATRDYLKTTKIVIPNKL